MVAVLLAFSFSANAQTNVLICGAPSSATWNIDVQVKLQATGFFSSVQIFNTSTGTPTVPFLQTFQAVLVFTDMGAADPVTLGNNLATYINGGGGVVNCVFANASVPISGNFNTTTYQVVVPASQTQGTVLTLGTILQPCHPIIQGVTNLNGGSSSYISTSTTLAPGAQTIANWSNGSWLAAYKTNVGPALARRADLNLYPPSSDARSDFWLSSSQGALLMGNALRWVAGVTSLTGGPAQPAAITGSASLCQGATATYSIPSVPGATSYTWTVPGGTVINSGQGTTSISITAGATSGTISVVATNSCGNSTPRTFTLTINPTPTVTATTANSAICAGGSTTLTAGGASTYTWNPGNLSGTSVTVSPSSNTTYTVTGTSAAGCTNTATVAVAVNALPVVTASAMAGTICDGQTDMLMSSGATSYTWNPGNLSGASVTVSPNTTTTYTVTGTDANGCVNTASVTLNVNALPTVTASAVSGAICIGSNDTLNASGAVSYVWSSGGNAAQEIVAPTGATTYTVTGTDANGCVNTATVQVLVNALPVVTLGNDVNQCGGTVTLDAQNFGSTFAWSTGGSAQTEVVSTSGQYSVLVTDANGCSNSDTINVTINSLLTVNLGADTTQCGGSVTLDAQNQGALYLWSDNSSSQTLVASASGTYYVTVTDQNGCQGSDTINVTINTLPNVTASASATTVCLDDANVTLTGSPVGGTWSGSSVTGNSFDPSVGVGAYTLTYTFVDSLGCSNEASVIVNVNACTGVNENNVFAGINMYPNPNNGEFTVAATADLGRLVIIVTDAQGRTVYSAQENNVQAGFSKQITLGDVASGIYFVRMTANGSESVSKIAVQK
ncbi:MAG: hypothetical protein Fur0041_00520 [Bacteroidia bacterium]